MLKRKLFVVLIFALVSVGCSQKDDEPVAPAAVESQSADYVFLNAKVYTSNTEQPWAEAVAVAGSDIVYVGDNVGAQAFVGEETYVSDIQGDVVLPGLIGTHEHPLATMAVTSGGVLSFSQDADIMLSEASEYLAENPNGPFFTFNGSQENTVPITKERIDEFVSDRPFLMVASTGHGGWINSEGLKALGVEKGKPDPIDSFERDENDEPTGNVPSSAAVLYALVELDLITKDGLMRQFESVFGEMARLGITAVYDPGQPVGMEEMLFSTMEQLENEGRLTARVVASALTQRERHLEGALKILEEYGPKYSSDFFNVNVLKLHGGSPDGYTSAMLEGYKDRPDFTGAVPYSPEAQKNAAIRAAEMGFDVHTHAIGTWNIKQALDTYQAVREAGHTETRLTTGHTGLVSDEQLQRYVEFDVIANTYGLRNAEPNFGPLRERIPEALLETDWQRMKSFVDAGVRLTASADWPTSPLDPFKQITVFMTRSTPDTDEQVPPLREILTLEESLRAYTIDAAYQLRMEDKIGSLEVGKKADIIVIDRDIFSLTPDEIWDTKVLSTMVNGKVVYLASEVTAEIGIDDFPDLEFHE